MFSVKPNNYVEIYELIIGIDCGYIMSLSKYEILAILQIGMNAMKLLWMLEWPL